MRRQIDKSLKVTVNALMMLLALHLLGCVSAGTKEGLRVESQPAGSEVQVLLPGQSAKKLGVTPLTISENDVGNLGTSFQVQVAREGFASKSILFPATPFQRKGSVFLNLEETPLPAACVNQEAAMNKATRGLAEAYGYISGRKYDQAESLLLSLSTEFSNVSLFFDLLGNVHFLKKNFDKALATYRRSAQLNPSNAETTRMIQRIEAMKSGRGT